MRAVIALVVLLLGLGSAFAAPPHPATPAACAAIAPPSDLLGVVEPAQSNCRGDCSSRRGFCMSTCKDAQCRAICNSVYQSCVASCR